jgi:hypothetical protein
MDEAERRFRRQVSRELGARRGAERRYSLELRHAALAYWRQGERAGEGLHTVATALGVAPVSLALGTGRSVRRRPRGARQSADDPRERGHRWRVPAPGLTAPRPQPRAGTRCLEQAERPERLQPQDRRPRATGPRLRRCGEYLDLVTVTASQHRTRLVNSLYSPTATTFHP